MSSASPVWFITGCSAGFGKHLALLVLRAGHRVIASSRNPSKTPELVSEVQSLGGKWITLDVSAENVEKVMAESLGIYGRIDVLVNNAGYSLLGALEDFGFATLHLEAVYNNQQYSLGESREQMEVNFFGPLRTTKAVLPSMREKRSGTIVNFSSVAGFDGLPTCSLYAASKHALEGKAPRVASACTYTREMANCY
jgi:NAD(P)-dependent dehydrogenase (short-subunit alcohol dehydrogenase family)